MSLPLAEAAFAIWAEHLVEEGSAGLVEESVNAGSEGGRGDIGLGLAVPDELNKVVWGASHCQLHLASVGLDLQLQLRAWCRALTSNRSMHVSSDKDSTFFSRVHHEVKLIGGSLEAHQLI